MMAVSLCECHESDVVYHFSFSRDFAFKITRNSPVTISRCVESTLINAKQLYLFLLRTIFFKKKVKMVRDYRHAI